MKLFGARLLTLPLVIALAALVASCGRGGSRRSGISPPAGRNTGDFRLCNNTSSRVGVAIGYKNKQGWVTEGWWNLPSRTCETLVKGNLVARYYYVYAIDYDRGGEWMGQAYMCTRDKKFTIFGIKNCLARGYDRTGFFEVDTGAQHSWTVQLTDSSRQPAAKPLPAGNPLSEFPPTVARTAPPATTAAAHSRKNGKP